MQRFLLCDMWYNKYIFLSYLCFHRYFSFTIAVSYFFQLNHIFLYMEKLSIRQGLEYLKYAIGICLMHTEDHLCFLRSRMCNTLVTLLVPVLAYIHYIYVTSSKCCIVSKEIISYSLANPVCFGSDLFKYYSIFFIYQAAKQCKPKPITHI